MIEMVTTMLFIFVLSYSVHGFILGLLVWSAEHLPGRWRLRSQAWRELLWRIVLLAPLFTTAFQLQSGWKPPLGVVTAEPIVIAQSPEFSGSVAAQQSTRRADNRLDSGEQVVRQPDVASNTAKLERDDQSSSPPASQIIPQSMDSSESGLNNASSLWPVVWLLITVVLLIRLLGQFGKLRQLRRTAVPVNDTGLQQAACTLAADAGLERAVLISHPDVQGPATFTRRTICLPGWADELSTARQRAMLAHELGHIKRADVAWLGFGAMLQALFWTQPLLPLARRRLMVLAELQADSLARELLNGDGRELAGCLTECARRMRGQLMPGLAAAMSHPAKQPAGRLTERVQLLISSTPLMTEVPMYKKTLLICAALTLALILPAVNVQAEKHSGYSSSYEINDDSGHVSMSLSLSDGDNRMRLRAEGEIEFMPDDSGIEAMSEGSEFTLTQQQDGVHRRLEASGSADGSIDYEYSVDDQQQPFDSSARAWLAQALSVLLVESGINAETRIEHVLQAHGHDGVMNTIHEIDSSHSLSKHIQAYSGNGRLQDDQLDDVLAEVNRIHSDYSQSRTLSALSEDQLHVKHGDAQHASANQQRAHKIVIASEGVQSDYELRHLLENLSEHVDASDTNVHGAILQRAAEMDSDYELRETLSALAEDAAVEPQLAEHWLDAAEQLDSDFELRQALEQLAHAGPREEATWVAMLKLAGKFDSDFERATFLATAAEIMPRSSSTEAAYKQAVDGINSNYERERAARALG